MSLTDLSGLSEISDLDICGLIANLYSDSTPADWDFLDMGSDDGVCWAIRKLGGVFVVIDRGSVTTEDWTRDLDALSTNAGRLGKVHAGFWKGIPEQYLEMLGIIDSHPWISCGHSLGAARSCLLTAHALVNGHPPLEYVRFGEPRPGYQQLATLLSAVPGRSYRNIHGTEVDRVTEVPFDISGLFPYVHPQPFVDLRVVPNPSDTSPFNLHHIELYQGGLTNLNPIPTLSI